MEALQGRGGVRPARCSSTSGHPRHRRIPRRSIQSTSKPYPALPSPPHSPRQISAAPWPGKHVRLLLTRSQPQPIHCGSDIDVFRVECLEAGCDRIFEGKSRDAKRLRTEHIAVNHSTTPALQAAFMAQCEWSDCGRVFTSDHSQRTANRRVGVHAPENCHASVPVWLTFLVVWTRWLRLTQTASRSRSMPSGTASPSTPQMARRTYLAGTASSSPSWPASPATNGSQSLRW